MSGERLFVFAKITPKSEYFDNAKQAIIDILKPTRSEPGCHQFELHENILEGHLFLYEEWEDAEALDEHYQKPYTSAVFENYEEWLASPVEVSKMKKYSEAA